MGKHKKKKREDSNGNPKPSKRAKTDKPSRSAKSKKAPPAQPVPAAAPVPAPARAAQQGGGDVDPEAEPQPYQLGDPLPPRIQYKTKPKYWVHNLPDGYGKSAGLVSRCARLIDVSAGLVTQGRRWLRGGRIDTVAGVFSVSPR